jgi:hypothetical protein
MFTLFINVSYVYVYIFIHFSILITGIILPSECKWLFKIKNAKAGNTGAEIKIFLQQFNRKRNNILHWLDNAVIFMGINQSINMCKALC